MLPLRLGASSLRVDYDQASRYLQPSFNSNLRKFSFKLRLCSLVYDRLTTAMQCGGMETSLTLSLYHIVSPQQYGGTERQRKEELLQQLFGRTCALCPTFGAGYGKKNIILRKCVHIQLFEFNKKGNVAHFKVLEESLVFGPCGSIDARTRFRSVFTRRRPRIDLGISCQVGRYLESELLGFW